MQTSPQAPSPSTLPISLLGEAERCFALGHGPPQLEDASLNAKIQLLEGGRRRQIPGNKCAPLALLSTSSTHVLLRPAGRNNVLVPKLLGSRVALF